MNTQTSQLNLCPINKDSPIYEKFNKLCGAKGELKWVVNKTKKEVHARVQTWTNKHAAFVLSMDEIDGLPPILMDLIQEDSAQPKGSVYTTVRPSWHFWHDPGVLLETEENRMVFIKEITYLEKESQLVENDQTHCAAAWNYRVSFIAVGDIRCAHCYEVKTHKTMTDQFLEENYPGLISAFSIGQSMGLSSAEIVEHWRDKQFKNDAEKYLPDLDGIKI